ncbi:hypothetical protein [Kribbella sp. CA-247076]|uniref:hypothetical protein n=1 Tax=Kribbella sp. CA-247076 TaxID=3239941 RepID=UPI003D8C5260
MTEIRSRISFDAFETDDDLVLDRLSKELAVRLRDVGEVSYAAAPVAPGDKGAGELMVATLNVLTGVDPAQIEAMIRILGSFTRRNAGRRVHVRVGDRELSIDRPTDAQVDSIVEWFVSSDADRTE